jgi:DNA topoisomerase-1
MSPKPATQTEAKRTLNTCVKAVAGLLGNTPAVCRGLHPSLVLEAYQQGVLPLKPGRSARAFELAVIRFLEAAKVSCGVLTERGFAQRR